MSQIRVAVIGAGHLGRIHSKLISTIESAELVAVADPSLAARQKLLEQTSVRVVSDYRTLLDKIDAAIVATPTHLHYPIAAELLNAHKHALIEKPLTDSVRDAEELVELSNKNGCVVSVGHCEQFNASIRKALETVGKPKFIQATRMSGYTFRSTDIGVVNDLMIHDIDLVNSMFPGELMDVRSSGFSVFGHHEDMAQARIQFDCGGVANLTASRCSYENQRQIQIFGTEGFASVDLAKHQVETVYIPSWMRNRQHDFLAAPAEQQAFIRENLFSKVLPRQQSEVEPVNAILCEQQDWLDAIKTSSLPRVSCEQGKQAVAIARHILDGISLHHWQTTMNSKAGPMGTFEEKEHPDPLPAELGPARTPLRKAA